MDIVMSAMGVLGAALVVAMYALLERGRVGAENIGYYAANGIGALMILVSLAWNFDTADLGGIALQVCWIIVSIMGIVKVAKLRVLK